MKFESDFRRVPKTDGVLLRTCVECERKKSRKANYDSDLRFRKYGLTREDFEEMLWLQDNKCAICQTENPDQIDHDHVTGKVRDILCKHCNLGLGHFRDSSELVQVAAEYLKVG